MLRWLRNKLAPQPKVDEQKVWPSVVMLLKEPVFPNAEEVIKIANACWGQTTPVELAATEDSGSTYTLRRGNKAFSIHQGRRPYDVEGQEPTEILQRPWDEHRAWLSIDMPLVAEGLRETKAWGESHKLLLIYAFKSWSPNCLAIYFPAEGVTVPNLGDLAESIRWGRQNGLKLAFLT
jgi:hypothetical protein